MATTCQRCKQRPATVHVTELAPVGGHAEAHLCGVCCQEVGWQPTQVPPPVAELASAAPDEAASRPEDPAACPGCGLQWPEYHQVNLLGCAHDWTVFAAPLSELVERWHGAARHVGRRPGDPAPAVVDAERAAAEAELAAAVADERYEDAARLRDRLRQLGWAP